MGHLQVRHGHKNKRSNTGVQLIEGESQLNLPSEFSNKQDMQMERMNDSSIIRDRQFPKIQVKNFVSLHVSWVLFSSRSHAENL